jgi:branched-chain amino acid transport system substrate-binding protein
MKASTPKTASLRRLAGVALGAALLLLGQAAVSAAAEAPPLLVGVNLPMTGQVAAFGQMSWAGMQIANQMKPEVLGRPVKLVLVDNKSDNVEAANASSRLVTKEKAAAVLGPSTSSQVLAAGPISEEHRVPLIAPTATSPIVTQDKNYVFRVCFIDPFQGVVAARYAYQELGARKAAILTDIGQDYAVGLTAFFVREFTRQGGKVVARVKCSTGDQDFSAQLGTVKAAEPDMLYLPNYYSEDALVARQAQELGLAIPILSGDGADAPELLQIGGKAVEGLTFTSHFHRAGAASPLGKEFLARYDRARAAGQIQEDITAFHALGAESYLVLIDAIARAGSSEGPKIRQALANTKDFTGITGRISIGPDGNAVKSATVLKVDNGKFVYVTTIEP